ncbi:MAG: hypothetical protein KGL39_30160 [Patescibacteria group bacterium]|nr:hypothetical protein [Patescibacteria group bacterium]
MKTNWADTFPGMGAMKTQDERVFETKWKKVNKDDAQSPKIKIIFCCIVGGNCFGVDVIKPWATADSYLEETKALGRVIDAANYYEREGMWPSKD